MARVCPHSPPNQLKIEQNGYTYDDSRDATDLAEPDALFVNQK